MAAGECDYRRQALGRRRALQVAGVTGAGLAALAAGCSSTSKSTKPVSQPASNAATISAKQPKRGGTYRHPAYIDLGGQNFDPHTVSLPVAEPFGLYYQGLVGYVAGTFEVKPELAQKWEQPSDTQFIFHLQPGVKWHNKPPANGRPLTTDDVLFSLDRVRTNDPRFQSRTLLDTVDKFDAPDAATIRFNMKEPDAAMLAKLSTPGVFMLARDVVDKAGKFATAESVVGTGPFLMTAYEESVRAEYTRNPDYWKPGLPYLDKVIEPNFKDPQSQWAAFLGNQLDGTPVPGAEATKFIQQQGAGYKPSYYPNFACLLAQANTRKPPMNDVRVSRALRLLIDYKAHVELANTYNGLGRNAFIFPASSQAWDLSNDEYAKLLDWQQPKDAAVKQALSLLAAAGFTKESPLQFELVGGDAGFAPNVRPSSELLQANWNQLSQGVVQAKLNLPDIATQNSLRSQGNFTALLGGTTGWSDPDVSLTIQIQTKGSRNYTAFSDQKADDMIGKQRHTLDVNQRHQIVRDIITYLLDVYPASMTAVYSSLAAAKPQVQGFRPEIGFDGRSCETIWLDV